MTSKPGPGSRFPHALGRARVALCLACLACLACGPSDATGPPEVRFDGERAFADLKALVRIGPRSSGSAGAAAARRLIGDRLRQAGWRVEEQNFRAGVRNPQIDMVNVIGSRAGRRPAKVMLVTHYDTKRIPGIDFVGANDGASGVAVLLEFARQLGAAELEHEVQLVFFDGEEALAANITEFDGLYGSSWLAQRMETDGTLAEIHALLLVDMVGDADLNLAIDQASSPRLRRLAAQAAIRLDDPGLIDPDHTLALIDDHSPFIERGVSNVLALIDFQYGERRSPGSRWHTARDDLDGVSARSLNRAGRLLVELFRGVDSDPAGPAPAGVAPKKGAQSR